MPLLNNYHEVLVIQRQLQTGCVSSAIEWMLRYLKISGIDFNGFQERYDLIYQKKGNNNFSILSSLIKQDYPKVNLICRSFGLGREKLDFIKSLIGEETPVLISVSEPPNWHIMPIVEMNDYEIISLSMIGDTVEAQKRKYMISDIESRHNNLSGGKDILYWGEA